MKIFKKFDIDDGMILLGVGGALYGIWLIYHPVAYILAGAALAYLGLSGKKSDKTRG